MIPDNPNISNFADHGIRNLCWIRQSSTCQIRSKGLNYKDTCWFDLANYYNVSRETLPYQARRLGGKTCYVCYAEHSRICLLTVNVILLPSNSPISWSKIFSFDLLDSKCVKIITIRVARKETLFFIKWTHPLFTFSPLICNSTFQLSFIVVHKL